jgi:hypothetical protein
MNERDYCSDLFAYLDENNQVVTCADAEELAQHYSGQAKRRIVGKTRVNQFHISTVFLGINYGNTFGNRPQWFETMVFGEGDEKSAYDQYYRRYETWNQAQAGHDELVEMFRYGYF